MAFSLPNRNKSILERRFIDQVLEEEGRNIVNEQARIDRKFNFIATGSGRSHKVSSNKLVLQHSIVQRFRDMSKISGRPQKSSRQHNAVLYGHFNNIRRSLRFGFTREIQKQLSNNFKIPVNG